jgi:hypothetical protein
MHPPLILKRSELAHAGFEDYVLCEGELVGRIYCSKNTDDWFWGLLAAGVATHAKIAD